MSSAPTFEEPTEPPAAPLPPPSEPAATFALELPPPKPKDEPSFAVLPPPPPPADVAEVADRDDSDFPAPRPRAKAPPRRRRLEDVEPDRPRGRWLAVLAVLPLGIAGVGIALGLGGVLGAIVFGVASVVLAIVCLVMTSNQNWSLAGRACRCLIATALGYALLPLVPFVLNLVITADTIPADQWRDFRGTEGKYRVLMPGQVVTETKTVPNSTVNVQVQVHSVTLTFPRSRFEIALVPMSPDFAKLPPEQRYHQAIDAMLKAVPGSKMLGSGNVAAGGHPGREYIVDRGQSGKSWVRIFFVGPDMIAMNAQGFMTDADARRFLESLEVLAPPEE
jgi:hypothetical protein